MENSPYVPMDIQYNIKKDWLYGQELRGTIRNKNTPKQSNCNVTKIQFPSSPFQPDGDLPRSTVASFQVRKSSVYIKWVKEHTGHERNEGANCLATVVLSKEKASFIDLNPHPTLLVTGTKLSTITQSTAYKAIVAKKERDQIGKGRHRTEMNVIRIQNCTEDQFGYIPSVDQIWASMRNKDNSRTIRDFLWKTTHDAYWAGTHWLRESMPESLKEQAFCKHCMVIEDMEHILTKHGSPGQNLLWSLAERLWRRKKSSHNWCKLTIGDILGCGTARIIVTGRNKPHPGQNRLWRILIAETAHLTWKLQCKRVIELEGSRSLSETEIRNSWIRAMNERLDIDRQMTRLTSGTKPLSKKLVISTGRGLPSTRLDHEKRGFSG